MTPSRSAAIAATCGTPPESTASCRTLSMAVPSMDALIVTSWSRTALFTPWHLTRSTTPGQAGCLILNPESVCQRTLTLVDSNVSRSSQIRRREQEHGPASGVLRDHQPGSRAGAEVL